jgi:integrase
MPAVGRKRTKNLRCPPGVFVRGDVWHWQPTSKRERDERKAKGLPASVRLGKADTKEAREKWAGVSGYRDAQQADGTVGELLRLWQREAIATKPNGLPRAASTVELYEERIPHLLERFGAAKYGKTEYEAARGLAIGTATIQAYVSESRTKILANRDLAVLSNAFDYAIRKGRTTYNPCEKVAKNASEGRTREPKPWEVECLRTLATPFLGLLMDAEGVTGWRITEILSLQRNPETLTAEGIVVRRKGGKRELWEWTPELRRIIAEAENLPGANIERFDLSTRKPLPRYVFPTKKGDRLDYDAFWRGWDALRKATNAMLAECAPPLHIEDLHFHDLRSKAHDDAEEQNRAGNDLLGNSKAVAKKHYSRRMRRVRALG